MSLVKKILSREGRPSLRTIDAAQAVSDAIVAFSEVRHRCLPVVDADKLVGVVTVRDLVRHLAEHGAAGMSLRVDAAMTRNPTTTSITDSVESVDELFTGQFNHLPVLDGEKLVGVLTPSDILGERLGDVRALASDLERYIKGY